MEHSEGQILRLELGELGTNCYIMAGKQKTDARAGQDAFTAAVIIDPAAQEGRIISALKEYKLEPAAILLTHGHYDHFGAADALRKEYHIPVYAMESEKNVLSDPYRNLSTSFSGSPIMLEADEWLHDGQLLELAGMQFEVIASPGHTPGGCCYYRKEQDILFSGDTLFRGSVGRTDFPGGSMAALCQAIRSRLFILPPQTQVLPGHGEPTTIEYEMRYNPFL